MANKDYNSTENQRIKGNFVGREIYCNVNQMAEYILQKSFEDSNAPFTYEDLDLERFSYTGEFISFDELTRDQKDEAQGEIEALIEKIEEFKHDCEVSDSDYNYISEGLYTIDQLDEIRNELEEVENLDGDCIEVYEWWAVSSWLAKKLEEKGEVIADAGATSIWGRNC